MKTVVLCVLVYLSMPVVITAQTTQTKASADKQAAAKNKRSKQTGQGKRNSKDVPDITYALSDTSTNAAFYNRQFTRLQISDPVIKTLNAKASGAAININGSGLIGVPKGTYGFANGRISLYQVGATSTGTATGSGSVGTGSSPGGIGTLGPVIGVNGKSPFTGTGPYGTRITVTPQVAKDSIIRKRY